MRLLWAVKSSLNVEAHLMDVNLPLVWMMIKNVPWSWLKTLYCCPIGHLGLSKTLQHCYQIPPSSNPSIQTAARVGSLYQSNQLSVWCSQVIHYQIFGTPMTGGHSKCLSSLRERCPHLPRDHPSLLTQTIPTQPLWCPWPLTVDNGPDVVNEESRGQWTGKWHPRESTFQPLCWLWLERRHNNVTSRKKKTGFVVIDEVSWGCFMSAGVSATVCIRMMPLAMFPFVEN